MDKTPIPPTHLGDGVYAEFDGYHINLRVNDHRNPIVVALEPRVLQALNLYKEQIDLYIKKRLKESGV